MVKQYLFCSNFFEIQKGIDVVLAWQEVVPGLENVTTRDCLSKGEDGFIRW